MANNTTDVEVLQINTQPAVKSISSLKQEIKDLKSQLLNLDRGTAEYNETLTKLGNDMHDLKEIQEQAAQTNNDFGTAMGNTTKALAGAVGAVGAVTGALSLMGVQIGDDTKLMKTLVAAMSVTQGVAAAESGVKAVKALANSIKASTAAQKLFNTAAYKNPYIIAAAALVATLTTILTLLNKQRKEEQARHEEAMRHYEAEREEINKNAQASVQMIKTLADYKIQAEKMTAAEKEAEEARLRRLQQANSEARTEIENTQEYQDLLEDIADKEAYIVNMRNTTAPGRDKAIENAEKQLADLNESIKIYKDAIAARTADNRLIERQIELLHQLPDAKKSNSSKSSVSEIRAEGEALNSLIDRRIKLNQIYEDYSDEVKKAFNEIPSVVDKGTNEIGQRITSVENVMQSAIDASEKRRDKIQQSLKAYEPVVEVFDRSNDVMRIIPERFYEAGKAFDEYTDKQKAEINLATKLYTEFEKESIVLDDLTKALKEYCLQKDLQVAEDTHAIEASKNTVAQMQNETAAIKAQMGVYEGTFEGLKEHAMQFTDYVWFPNVDNFDQIQENADRQMAVAEQTYNSKMELLDNEYNAEKEYYEKLAELYVGDEEKQLEIRNTLSELDAEYQLNKTTLEQETSDQIVAIDQEATEKRKALIESVGGAYQTLSSSISSLIGGLADTQEQGTRSWKNLKTTEAVINTLAGSVSAFMSGVNSGIPAPYNMILAATLATATLASGFATVKKIQNTKVSKSSSGSSASTATVQTISNPVSNVRTTNPQWNDEGYVGETMQSTETSTTVTLVTSDLEALNSQNVNIKNNNSF